MQPMRQTTLAECSFAKHMRPSRKELFLDEMDQMVPWSDLVALIEPHYPKAAGRGRPAVGLGLMLRVYFMQLWFGLSDPGAEDLLYAMPCARKFAGVDLGRAPAPDESTICKFRHLLEDHDLADQALELVNEHLAERGVAVSEGTIADATMISAPNSRKNNAGKPDPEMRNGRKSGGWTFGMKAHVGVDKESRLIHSVEVTPANRHESPVAEHLVREGDKEFYGDTAYAGTVGRRLRKRFPDMKDRTCRKAKRDPSGKYVLSADDKEHNKEMAPVRSRVEHVFQVMKCRFGFRKARFKGLAKNRHHIVMLCALVNLALAKDRLLAA